MDNINNKLNQILVTEANEIPHFGLPFIGLRDTFFNNLLSKKKKSIDSNNNNSLNIRKTEEENNILNYSKSPIKFGPQIPSKINKNSLENKANSCSKSRKPNIIKNNGDQNQYLFENMKLNININKNKNNTKITNGANTFIHGNLALSLTNEKNMNRRKKFNRYNYDYHYNFNTSPNRKLLIKDTYNNTLNNTNNNMNIIPTNIKNSEQNIKTILKKYSRGDNKNNCKSPEIKSIFNNIKINININSKTVDKVKEKNQAHLKTLNSNNNVKYSYNIDIPKNFLDKKLYIITDANKDINNDAFRSIVISPNKNYINKSERSNKRKGISLPKNNNKNTNYNLSKIIQNVKYGNKKDLKNDMIKKNKSYVDNHSTIENNDSGIIKKNKDGIKIINNENNVKDKRKNKEDLLRYILFNTKNYQHNNKNNILTLNNINNYYLPKLNDHIYNHYSEKKI